MMILGDPFHVYGPSLNSACAEICIHNTCLCSVSLDNLDIKFLKNYRWLD
jgi:hypothetical protein